MEDATSIVPCHNSPHEDAFFDDIFTFDDSLNPNNNIDESSRDKISDDTFIDNVIDLLDDPSIMGFLNTSYIHQTSNNPQFVDQGQANIEYSYGNSVSLSDFPVPDVPFSCCFCQVLREITHCNGNHTTKLEIHGRLGMICHAILDHGYHTIDNADSRGTKYHMFDFSKKSIEDVKEFLRQYCDERKKEGYIMLQDPLSVYYKALCVGLGLEEDIKSSGMPRTNRPKKQKLHRTPLSAQRERTRTLSLDNLAEYFHLPIEKAARQMNVCLTVVKRICRRNGLPRWPHRKVKSFYKRISRLRDGLNSTSDVREKARTEEEILRIQRKIVELCGGIPPKRF